VNDTGHEETPLWPLTHADQGWAFELAPATATALLDLIEIASRWPAGDDTGSEEG
jgi:hypothetical protein